MTADPHLEREADRRRLAAAAAALGALIPFAGGVVALVVNGHDHSRELTGQLLFQHRYATGLLVAAVLQAVGTLFVALPLSYLFDAVKARRPEVPPVARICALAGPVLVGVGVVAYVLIRSHKADLFATAGSQTRPEAKHLLDSTELKVAQAAALAGSLALGFAFVIIALNAMRVGLLTRFMGVLGIIVGVLLVIPLGPPIVQAFWLGALAYLIAGRWPGGMPPAWASGRAEPWPSRQELLERDGDGDDGDGDRDRDGDGGRSRRRAPEPDPEPEPEPAAPARPAHPTSKKRKRKKRR